MLGVEINQSDISIAHGLSPKPAKDTKEPDPPAIIARFVSRSLRNEIYSKRKLAKTIDKSKFSVKGMPNLYVNEILTKTRKQLLWRTKQAVKEKKVYM